MGNLALGKTAKASGYVAPFTAAMAVNGGLTATSRWLCNPVPCWLSVDLGSPRWINRWVVRHMGIIAGWPSPSYNMSDFTLQGSNDNLIWTSIDSVIGNTLSVTDKTFTACQYRFVRVYVTKGLNINNLTASMVEFEVYEAPPTPNFLSGLSLSKGTLSPTFVKTTTSYTASVDYDTASITVTPTAEDADAQITVSGVEVASGQASEPINLNVGVNAIKVVVIPVVGSAMIYTTTVTRASSPYLSGLTLSAGTLNPAFVRKTNAYTVSVDYGTSSITVTPTAEDPNATIKVNGTTVASGRASGPISLNVGANTITVEVTAAVSGVKQTYTVTVTREASDNAFLKSLELNGITLNEPFNGRNVFRYTANVANSIQNTAVTAVAEDSMATIAITVNGTAVAMGQTVDLNEGSNNIEVKVTANSGAIQTYTVVVARERSVYLTNLVVVPNQNDPDAKFEPAFNSDNLSYTFTVTAGVTTSVKITPTAATGCTVTINGQSPMGGSRTINLTSLPMSISVKVSKGGVDVTYTIVVKN